VRAAVLLTSLLPSVLLAAEALQVTPLCESPAPLYGQFIWRGVVVHLWDDIPGHPPREAGAALARKYGFKIESWERDGHSFLVSALAPSEIAKLRCEHSVRYIAYEGLPPVESETRNGTLGS